MTREIISFSDYFSDENGLQGAHDFFEKIIMLFDPWLQGEIMRGLMQDFLDAPEMVGPCNYEIKRYESWIKNPWTTVEPSSPGAITWTFHLDQISPLGGIRRASVGSENIKLYASGEILPEGHIESTIKTRLDSEGYAYEIGHNTVATILSGPEREASVLKILEQALGLPNINEFEVRNWLKNIGQRDVSFVDYQRVTFDGDQATSDRSAFLSVPGGWHGSDLGLFNHEEVKHLIAKPQLPEVRW